MTYFFASSRNAGGDSAFPLVACPGFVSCVEATPAQPHASNIAARNPQCVTVHANDSEIPRCTIIDHRRFEQQQNLGIGSFDEGEDCSIQIRRLGLRSGMPKGRLAEQPQLTFRTVVIVSCIDELSHEAIR